MIMLKEVKGKTRAEISALHLLYHKKGQMQFSWLFALILGAAILFIAIFFSGRLLETGTYQSEAELAAKLEVILNPLASLRQEGTLSANIDLGRKTEISFKCDEDANKQTVTVSLRNQNPFSRTIQNKYIFSEDFNERNLFVFGKSFSMPWRVDDLIYIVSRNYCFLGDIPEDIKDELKSMNSSRIIVQNPSDCEKTVCFGAGECDFNVYYNSHEAVVNGETFKFLDDSTLYAIIFDPKDYNCNKNRLIERLKLQASIFTEKAGMLSQDCPEISGVISGLHSFSGSLDSGDEYLIRIHASEVEEKNRIVYCSIF